MNYKVVINVLGKTLLIAGVLLLLPLIINFIYREAFWQSFVYPAAGLILVGLLMSLIRPREKSLLAKEGIVIVALAWLFLSLVGAVPFVISGAIPNYIDALFETASGFTTTGASVLSNVEALPHCILFWRSFTHYLGGMGVLVFVLAVIPKSDGAMHIYRAESPGPTASKLVSKMSYTARILYGIYVAMSVVLFLMLLFGGVPAFDSVMISFSTAGTGGFSITNNGVAAYNSVYVEVVISVFMFLFSINFNVYYLILVGSAKKAFKSEELRWYAIIIFAAIALVTANLYATCKETYASLGGALKDAAFHVTAISSTTGISNNVDFDKWPTFSKAILFVVMVCGAMAGSTGGGIKMGRIMLLFKTCIRDIKKTLHPRSVNTIKFEDEAVDSLTLHNAQTFFSLWFALVVATTIILSIDGFDLLTNISASITCLNNVGPGFGSVGPLMNYSGYAWYSKLILTFDMLAGRLEIFPMIILMQPSTWRRG